MARFFTSDLHFFHGTITEKTDRKLFVSPEDHVQWLVDTLNRQAGPRDTIVSLGDFSFGTAAKTAPILSQILAKEVIFISGNHDSFQRPADRVWYKEISINGTRTVLSHFAFESWHKQHKGSFHLHGHSHGNLAPRGRRLDVGIDNAFKLLGEHRMFSEGEVFDILSGVEVVVADSHRTYVGENDDHS